ncbi:serine hydrolase, partial [Nodosilinea sp. LEGE 07298]|uniref:serine hydrolase n=1 Tax=Nodosilinea sp. LEGE 07298 TaxID=2777970 RepID=UPI0018806475
MRGWWLQALKPVVMVGILAANVVLPKFPVAAPERGHTPTAAVPQVETLVDLYHLRDRLGRELHQSATVMVATRSGVGRAPAATLDQLWAIDRRLQQEDAARRLWHRAEKAAAAAIALGNPATLPPDSVAAAYTHWNTAIAALSQIAPEVLGASQTTIRRQQYEQQRAIAAYHYDTARSEFLVPIVEQTGMAARVRLTVCNLERECRRWQGNQPPANPASLIKVPVAIALMTHLYGAGIDPAEPVWVDPSNWTEDAGTTWVRTEYPLAQIMADMISASSNIATNQLIDYLGWEGVNQSLHSRGYRATRIHTKLVGESTYPANVGNGPNLLTTDELTDMMVAIYNQEVPHAGLIQAALAEQRDRNLGHTAVRPPITWLGEKTGRNSKVLGTTTAISVGGQRYIITVTLDRSANETAVRSIVTGVIQHLLTHDGFE